MLGPLQLSCLRAAAALAADATAERVALGIGENTPTGKRKVRRCLDGLERRGLVTIDRRAVVGALPGQGPSWTRRPHPGEEPTYRAGDPIPGRQGETYPHDVVVGRRDQVLVANVVRVTDAGRAALDDH